MADYQTVTDALEDIRVEPYRKLNGQTVYRVYLGEQLAGQFHSRANARRFVRRELVPHLRRLAG